MLRQITIFRGSKALLWNFQCVKCLDKHVKQDGGREEKAEVERQSSKKGFERMSMPEAWREFSWFRIVLPLSIKRCLKENSKLI